MIPEFVKAFDDSRATLREGMRITPPTGYEDIVTRVVTLLADGVGYGGPDPDRIVMVDHGNYQGTHVFVVGEKGYQPSTYWYVRVSYGSCSGCDAFEYISGRNGYGEALTDEQLDAYMTMALHIVQRMKQMDDEVV